MPSNPGFQDTLSKRDPGIRDPYFPLLNPNPDTPTPC